MSKCNLPKGKLQYMGGKKIKTKRKWGSLKWQGGSFVVTVRIGLKE